MHVTLRPATPDEAPAVARIYVESWNAGFGQIIGTIAPDEHRVARWAADLADGLWWVAEDGGAVVGFVGIGPSRDPVEDGLGELDTIAVDPVHWRRGIGRRLMDQALAELADRFDEAIVWTVAGYDAGVRFYETTGWRRDGGSRNGGRQMSLRHRLEK